MIQPEATRDAALQSARQERLGGDGNPWYVSLQNHLEMMDSAWIYEVWGK